MAFCSFGQEQAALANQLKEMAHERDTARCREMMQHIIRQDGLDSVKDRETFDVLWGNLAIAFLRNKAYDRFRESIGRINSRFNQTSFMSTGAGLLITEGIDTAMAEQLARETLDLFASFKDDPAARPAEMPESDWKRFMGFAQYPYFDTYAMALDANGKIREALEYQEKAFNGPPEEGLSASVARYARLLAANGEDDKAYDLLTSMARQGKATAGMIAQLRDLYQMKNGSAAGFDAYLDKLQRQVESALEQKLRSGMLSTPAPDFRLLDLQGKEVSLSDFRGKVVVLDFWATWCAPCIASFPAMRKMVERHPEVSFLFVATQEKGDKALERVKAFIERNKEPFRVLMDKARPGNPESFEAASAYKVTGIPSKAVIDARGILRFRSAGFNSDSELMNELEAMIHLARQ